MSRIFPSEKSTELISAIYSVVLPAGFFLLLAMVLAIPSYFETTTLWYKIGLDKIMLIGAQFLGLTALVLLYLQIILSTRGKFLDRVFGPENLIKTHRLNALLIIVLAAGHILLVLIPEGIANLPLGIKFWPEMIGATLFLLLTVVVATSYFRQKLHLPYRIWRSFHKPAGYLVLLLVTVHVLFVSESFEQTVPRLFILAFFTSLVLWTAAVKYQERPKQPNTINRRQS